MAKKNERLWQMKRLQLRLIPLNIIISEWLAFLFDAKKCGSVLPLIRFCEFLNIEPLDGGVNIKQKRLTDAVLNG
ncbi:MAG: hypothetical protein K2L42_06050 [Clostridia bacterium]|nr:hypothetical protein [Clostridia bacterium]